MHARDHQRCMRTDTKHGRVDKGNGNGGDQNLRFGRGLELHSEAERVAWSSFGKRIPIEWTPWGKDGPLKLELHDRKHAFSPWHSISILYPLQRKPCVSPRSGWVTLQSWRWMQGRSKKTIIPPHHDTVALHAQSSPRGCRKAILGRRLSLYTRLKFSFLLQDRLPVDSPISQEKHHDDAHSWGQDNMFLANIDVPRRRRPRFVPCSSMLPSALEDGPQIHGRLAFGSRYVMKDVFAG